MLRTCTNLNIKTLFLFCFALFFGSSLMLEAQPADFCSDAAPFPNYNSEGICIDTDFKKIWLTNTTTETEQIPSCVPDQAYNSRWYLFEAPSDTVDFTFKEGFEIGGIALYEQGECGNLTEVFCTSNSLSIEETNYETYVSGLTVGETYLMQFWQNEEDELTRLEICIKERTHPLINDDCSGAIPFPGVVNNSYYACDIPTIIDNTVAQDEGYPFLDCDGINNYSQWFTYEAVFPILRIQASNPETFGLALYENNCDSLVLLGCFNPNLGGFNVIHNLEVGETYLMAVWDDEPGQELNFCLHGLPGAANLIDCSTIPPLPGTIGSGENCAANTIVFDSTYAFNTPYHVGCNTQFNVGQWVSFVAPYTDLFFSEVSWTNIAVYGGDCGDLSYVACMNSDSGTINGLTVGETYYMYIWTNNPNYASFCLKEAIPTFCEDDETLLEIIVYNEVENIIPTWNLYKESDTGSELIAIHTDNKVCINENRCFTLYTSINSYNGLSTQNFIEVYYDGELIIESVVEGWDNSITFNCPTGEGCFSGEGIELGNHTAPNSGYWYAFTPEQTGNYEINTCSSENICNTNIYIYQQCLFYQDSLAGSLATSTTGCETGGDLAKLNVPLIAGETYYILVGDDDGDCESPINWEILYTPLTCTPNEQLLQIYVTTDRYPQETSWTLFDSETQSIVASEATVFTNQYQTYLKEVCVTPYECLDFTIYDSFGDGICCDWGEGSYEIYYNGELIAMSNGEFESSETITFNCCDEDNLPFWYEDLDGDGFGSNTDSIASCEPVEGFVSNNNDDCEGVMDCANVCNGTAITDDCGNCTEIDAPDYNTCICDAFEVEIETICPNDIYDESYQVVISYSGITEEGYLILDNSTGNDTIVNDGNNVFGPFENEEYSFTVYPLNNIQCAVTKDFEVDCYLTAIESINAQTDLAITTMHPMPTKDYLFVDFNSLQNESIRINVYSIVGALVETQEYQAQEGLNGFKLDLKDYPVGTYLMTLTGQEQGELVRRFVKQ